MIEKKELVKLGETQREMQRQTQRDLMLTTTSKGDYQKKKKTTSKGEEE